MKKRFDLLNKSIDIIHNTLAKDGDILNSIVELRSQKLNNFELDKALYKGIEEFNEYSLDNPILKNNEDYTKIEINLIESEAEIISLKKYYNDIVTKYNAITTKFPTSLVAKAKHYASKDLFIIEDHLELINSLKEQATPIKNN